MIFSDSERQLLICYSTRDRESHSIAVQRDTCWGNTMRGLPTSRDEDVAVTYTAAGSA